MFATTQNNIYKLPTRQRLQQEKPVMSKKTLFLVLVHTVITNAFVPYYAYSHYVYHEAILYKRQQLELPSTEPHLTGRRQRSRMLLAAAVRQSNSDDLPLQNDKAASLDNNANRLRKIAIVSWTHLISIFVLVNYFFQTCWPVWLTTPSRNAWTFAHAVSGMIFSGTILATTVMEWIVVRSRSSSVLKFWFQNVEFFETLLVLPALTLSIVSGVAQAFCDYEHLKLAPKHVKGSLHLLLLFGLWWGFTDRTTQRKARVAVVNLDGEDTHVPAVVYRRRWSNVVSCFFVLALYATMALKPWYKP